MINSLDVGIIIFVFLSAILGLFRGITKELLTLVSWIGAGCVSYFAFPWCSELARDHIASPMLADGVTILAIFIFFLVIFSFTSHLLSTLIQNSRLNSIDRSLGFGFGVLRGCILLFMCEAVLSCVYSRSQYPNFFIMSRFIEFITQGSDTLIRVTPHSIKKMIVEQRERLSQDTRHFKIGNLTDQAIEGVHTQIQNESSLQSNSPIKATESIEATPSITPEKQMEDLASLKAKKPEPNSSKPSKVNPTSHAELERFLGQVE